MRHRRRRFGAAVLLLTACGGSGEPTAAAAPRALRAVSISPSGSLAVGVGDTLRFAASVATAPGAPEPAVLWRLSPPGFATIQADGLLTAVGPGTFSLLAVATTPARGQFRADTLVGTAVVTSLPPAITALTVEPASLYLPVGSTARLVPQVTTASPAVQVTVTYQLLQNLGSIDANGVITTAFPGSTAVRIVATGAAPGYQTISLVAQPTLTIVPTPGITTFEVPPAITVPVGGTVKIPVTLVQPRGALTASITAENFTASAASLSGEFTEWSVTGLRVGSTNLTFRASFPGAGGYFAITRVASTLVTVVAP